MKPAAPRISACIWLAEPAEMARGSSAVAESFTGSRVSAPVKKAPSKRIAPAENVSFPVAGAAGASGSPPK